MSDPRVNELREILRANRPETPDLATPIRNAVDRQASALRADREQDSAFRASNELRARADELEQRVPPIHAGPRTDNERMWLEKAAALRAEADLLDATDRDDEK